MRALLLAFLMSLALPLQAASPFRGTVSHVTDGDTLWVRPAHGGAPVEVRLADIDAPEGCQAFGPQATRALAARVLHQPVQVRPRARDDYERVVAQVRHRGRDVGAWLVREGHAWSTGLRGRDGPYEALERQARGERRGLWAGARPIEPRKFRRAHGRCQ